MGKNKEPVLIARPQRFKIGDLVYIASSGYTGKIEEVQWLDGGWMYKLYGGTWRAEAALETYFKSGA